LKIKAVGRQNFDKIPQGSSGNSPAIYRWVKAEQRSKVPLGTTENISRLYETVYLNRCAPSAEALGYFRIGPCGTKSEKTPLGKRNFKLTHYLAI